MNFKKNVLSNPESGRKEMEFINIHLFCERFFHGNDKKIISNGIDNTIVAQFYAINAV